MQTINLAAPSQIGGNIDYIRPAEHVAVLKKLSQGGKPYVAKEIAYTGLTFEDRPVQLWNDAARHVASPRLPVTTVKTRFQDQQITFIDPLATELGQTVNGKNPFLAVAHSFLGTVPGTENIVTARYGAVVAAADPAAGTVLVMQKRFMRRPNLFKLSDKAFHALFRPA